MQLSGMQTEYVPERNSQAQMPALILEKNTNKRNQIAKELEERRV